MRCFVCHQEIADDRNAVLLGMDGDFACNRKCALQYEKDKDFFFEHIIHSEDRTIAYLQGADRDSILSMSEKNPKTHEEKMIARIDAVQRINNG